MTPIEAIHTFARRLCIEHLAELKQEWDRTATQEEKRDIYYGARRAVVGAILVEVERLMPADFRSRGHAALRLIETGQMAQIRAAQQNVYRQPSLLKAMQAERDRFADGLRRFTSQEDWKRWHVEPLPYRRTLKPEESEHLMASLRERWSITGKWWMPFEKYVLPYEAIVLNSTAVQEELGYEKLMQILADWGVQHVYELWERESEPDREIALSLWEPCSMWSERYWCTDELNWLLYTTHENSTTIAGDWLIQAIHAAWPNWESHQLSYKPQEQREE